MAFAKNAKINRVLIGRNRCRSAKKARPKNWTRLLEK